MKKVTATNYNSLYCITLVTAELVSLTQANPSPPGLSIKHGFVRSTGEIEPPTLPIQRVDNTYVLTDNILNYTLEIQRSDIVLDGAGFTIQGVYSLRYDGLTLSGVNNVTIKNLKLNVFLNGIALNNTSLIKVTNNRIDASTCIELDNVNGSEISSNTLSGKGYGILGQGTNNVINYNYFERKGITLVLSNNNSITDNLLVDQHIVSIEIGNYNQPSNSNIVSGNTIIAASPSNVPLGIGVFFSSNNSIYRNKIITNSTGIALGSSQGNVFYENHLESQKGVDIDYFYTDNTLSLNNTFYRNNFLNLSQAIHIKSQACANNWDNGSVGNYWSDYLTKYPQAKEIGNTTIGDTPYNLNVNNTDNYPLINPVNIEFPTTLPTPIAAPIVLTSNIATPTDTPSPQLEYAEPINPEQTPTNPPDTSPTSTPTTSPEAVSMFDSSKILLTAALLSILGLFAIILTVASYKRRRTKTRAV